jgi:NAD-dependent deacetylase
VTVARAGAVRLAELIRADRPVVALTGAGISVPLGIPDFRSPQTGLWANVDPMEVAHIDAFRRDPVRFWSFYGARFRRRAARPELLPRPVARQRRRSAGRG